MKEGQKIKGFFDKLGHLDFIVQAFEGFLLGKFMGKLAFRRMTLESLWGMDTEGARLKTGRPDRGFFHSMDDIW